MSSSSKPTDEQLDAAMPLLSSPQHEAYFFERLENPKWIGPLADRGVFDHPPSALHLEGGGIRFPRWPPSRYLARMASRAPAAVASILGTLETDNASVTGDMINAAQQMPPAVAASLVPQLCRNTEHARLWISLKDASSLCVQLAEADESDAAMQLANALFAPTSEHGRNEPRDRDAYWYKDGLKRVVPTLAERQPRTFLPQLCNWLETLVDAKRRHDKHSEHSYLWRAAIEEHEQNREYDFASVMVGFAREGFEVALRSGGLSLDEALGVLKAYPHLIFKRIRIYLINHFAEQSPELVRRTLLDRELFDDYEYKHEYALLVGHRLGLLSPEERNEWFGWIETGPDMSEAAAPTEEYRQQWIDDWKFEKLHWARKHLHGEHAAFYKQMLAKDGEPEMADINVRVSIGFRGDESPMTVDELATLGFDQAVNAVAAWRSEGSRSMGPSVVGLGKTFEQYVATNPEQFSTRSEVLVHRPAIFIRGFISQMTEALRAGAHLDVRAVLELCNWVVGRPIEERITLPESYDRGVDVNWQWTRDQICRFVEHVCTAREGDAPKYALEYRRVLWNLLESLCRDRAASYILHDPSDDDPRTRDYLDLAINSPRGKAVEAALEYARWVANHIKESEGAQESVPGGFASMPEVREMLEWQVAPNNRSFEAMAIIGSRIGLIYWIDKGWLAESAERLFSLEAIERGRTAAHGWAAWNAFLVWVLPHIDFYRLLRPQFAYAVGQSAVVNTDERGRHQPMHHLGEHLMILYGRGQLSLDDDGALLRRFLSTANPDVRQHAIGFVGYTLERDEDIAENVIDRFETLWDVYWSGLGKRDARESPSAWLFGTWFSSGKFRDRWALERLQQFVQVNPTPEPDHSLVEKLAEIAHIDITKAIDILDMMVRGDSEGWRVEGWHDAAKRILTAALNTPGEVRETAERLIDYLGRRGYTEFGRLLAPGPPSE